MRTYFALVQHEKDSAFGVRFPDISGVFSAADVRADVISNAIQALRLWAEDEVLPTPSDHDAIVARDDVREALAAGAYLVEVPLIEQESETVRANVSFDRGTLRAIDVEAARRKQTRAAFLADAARHEIERPFSRVDGKGNRRSRSG